MAETMKNCLVEISANGTTWTDISAAANSVSVDGGERMAEALYTFGVDVATITTGPREPLEVTVRLVYTEGSSDAFETVRAAYEDGELLYVRWSPRGGNTGDFRYTSGAGVIKSLNYPGGEAGSAEVVMCEFVLRTPQVTKSVVA